MVIGDLPAPAVPLAEPVPVADAPAAKAAPADDGDA
jgi:hypothetical protein